MSTPSYKGIVQDGLLYHTDLANIACLNYSRDITGATIVMTGEPIIHGLKTTEKTPRGIITLPDAGLTEIEMGRVTDMGASLTVDTSKGLLLTETYYPGIPDYLTTGTVADPIAGTYVTINGSYMQGFFKLEGYPFEALPARYAKGVTLETSLLIDPVNFAGRNMFFLGLGARSQNKFFKNFRSTSSFTTSNGIPLGPDHEDQLELGLEGNVIAFLFDAEGHIGYRAIADDLQVVEEYSTNKLTKRAWANISLSYTPCEEITDTDLLDCAPRRGGVLRVFVNGTLFHEFHGFQEYMFHGLQTEKEKQIGVPYTVSWGGGFFGLQAPWAFDENRQTVQPLFFRNNLLGDNFLGSFRGGMQTLRIYNRPLSVFEARENHNALAPRYGLPLVKGGRVTPKIDW